ncbi:MAG: hypothetical protein ACRDMX_07850 [Solirubrobacteraceae bacterium]
MRFRKLIRIGAPLAACLAAAAAFAGFALAAAGTHAVAVKTKAVRHGLLCVRYDTDDQPKCLRDGPRGRSGPRGRTGPRGYRGHRGPTGATGATGAVGATGPIGAVGATGAQGSQGARGIQGIQGIQGAPGTFAIGGAAPGGKEVEVLGTKVQPITFTSSTAPGTGTELPPSAARCPVFGPDQEAYDGGLIVSTTTTNDVVGIESAFPGLYQGSNEVDPLPKGSPPGAISAEPANGYEAQPVVFEMQAGDSVSYQAYVVCGP